MKYDGDYIVEQYAERERSAADIARELGCSERTVSSHLRKAGVPTRRRVKQNLKQDLSGRTFGRLTVVERVGEPKETRWRCVCKCGAEKIQTARSLLRKDAPVKSCGCARRKNHVWDSVPPYILSTIKAKARGRGIEFALTLEYCDTLFKKQDKKCALSGLPLSFGRRRDTTRTTASLDRIDSSLPYKAGNVQWVHKKVNIMKHSLSDREFVKLCCTIASHHGESK